MRKIGNLEIEQIAKLAQNDVYQQLGTSSNGLDRAEVQKRQEKYGKNILAKEKKTPLLITFLQNFTSLMAVLLWVAGGISFIAGLTELGIAIWSVNLINGLFSFWQEYQASKATAALNEMLAESSSVLREGKQQDVPAEQLVPGDIVNLAEGADIPADIRLLSSNGLRVDQSTLTGEVDPINKNADPFTGQTDTVSELKNFIFSGTSIIKGNATGVVVKIGMKTSFGQIASLTQNVQSELSPLQKELNVLTKQISLLAISIGALFFLAAVFLVHYPLIKSFIFALGMIVAFIPEGLLPTVTLSLAGAVSRMAQKNALVKKLSSVESLGSASVICSDKTGTLTQNQMTVLHLWTPLRSYHVTGQGYAPHGSIYDGPHQRSVKNDPELAELLAGGLLADNAKIEEPNDKHSGYACIGDPTEGCLEVAAQKGGFNSAAERKQHPRQKEFPFDSDRKMMTVVIEKGQERAFDSYTKGAPDNVLAKCSTYFSAGKSLPLTDSKKAEINAANDGYAKQGLRVLAVAGKILPKDTKASNLEEDQVESELTFLGLTAMYDPPRPEVKKAAAECRKAKIKVIMVTGDNGLTAETIAKRIGIVDRKKNVKVITGAELNKMNDNALKDALRGEIVFARMAPEQKYRVVDNLQQMKQIVAVTGDGVNDAPALKKADIGVAMGKTGTDVAKEAADMVLTDDNFASIVAAIKEGRGVYSNIRKFLLYILNSNLPEAIPSALFLLSGGKIPLALTVMEILFIDLGTDMAPALGLGRQATEKEVMNQPPRSTKEHLINKTVLLKAFTWYGALAALLSTVGFFLNNAFNGHYYPALPTAGWDYRQATTLALGAVIFCQMATVLNCRFDTETLFTKQNFFSNSLVYTGIILEGLLLLALCYVPFLQEIFGTARLLLSDWVFLFCLPLPLILLDELRKYLVRKNS
ncbi:cation transport ATPase [Ligilactobacillus salitolerans]|uniref:Cation transport ATPase n=1 Tax=Ligilactobacillus salitolerans TaxID=1808352 RepID=A0A401IQB2_9LACO|nr:cation-transporting P-type ATPase [Ligilactobacillus salitolerans]GBG93727.1 cation transport ATPase [Ligilactobacillus salitolerans]